MGGGPPIPKPCDDNEQNAKCAKIFSSPTHETSLRSEYPTRNKRTIFFWAREKKKTNLPRKPDLLLRRRPAGFFLSVPLKLRAGHQQTRKRPGFPEGKVRGWGNTWICRRTFILSGLRNAATRFMLMKAFLFLLHWRISGGCVSGEHVTPNQSPDCVKICIKLSQKHDNTLSIIVKSVWIVCSLKLHLSKPLRSSFCWKVSF